MRACAGTVAHSWRMMEAALSGVAANLSRALRQASAKATFANARLSRRLPLGYWNTVSIGSGSGL